MRVDQYAVPHPEFRGDQGLSEEEILDLLAGAVAEEMDMEKRCVLKNAAVLMGRLLDEVRAYRDAVEIDRSRPKAMQFQGWNMGRLAQARRITETALAGDGAAEL